MRIGIAAPIEVASLDQHFPNIKPHERDLGLGGTAVNIIIDGLIKEGHTITVFTLDSNIKDQYVMEGKNIKIIFGNFRRSSRFKILDFCSKEFRQIKRFIEAERNNIDIVNAHWSYEFAIGTILAQVPHLITFRDDSPTIFKLTKHPYRLVRMLMDFWVRKKGKSFSYNSGYLKSLIKLEGNIIPNPIKDIEITGHRKYPVKKEKMLICYIANGWDYRKNPEIAILAFSKLVKKIPNIELHLIGAGFEPDTPGYADMQNKGVNNKVVYRGAMAHHQLMKELNDFDIMLHTAREESFGNNLIEAMAKGIPVLGGYSSGAVPWVIGDAGSLADIENADDVSDKLEKLILDKSYYEELSLKGILNVKSRFSQTNVSKQYLNEYTNIINSL